MSIFIAIKWTYWFGQIGYPGGTGRPLYPDVMSIYDYSSLFTQSQRKEHEGHINLPGWSILHTLYNHHLINVLPLFFNNAQSLIIKH
jgi:hypothetical protein